MKVTVQCYYTKLYNRMSQVKAPIVKEADPAADKSIWQDGEESLDEEVI